MPCCLMEFKIAVTHFCHMRDCKQAVAYGLIVKEQFSIIFLAA